MARILRGRDKGKEVKIKQFSNDWVMCDDGKVHKITTLVYTPDELFKMALDDNTGIMFDAYCVLGNRFVKRRVHIR